jgi:hypothetical protein
MEDTCINLWVRLFKDSGFGELLRQITDSSFSRMAEAIFPDFPYPFGDRIEFELLPLYSASHPPLLPSLLPIQEL